MNNVTNYASFAEWHNLNYGSAYRTPSFDAIVRDMKFLDRQYDEAAGRFFYFTGQFHVTPNVRIDLTWEEVAMRYDNMYSNFSRYGTN
jgi:acyl carrier protein phosphodiesterase